MSYDHQTTPQLPTTGQPPPVTIHTAQVVLGSHTLAATQCVPSNLCYGSTGPFNLSTFIASKLIYLLREVES